MNGKPHNGISGDSCGEPINPLSHEPKRRVQKVLDLNFVGVVILVIVQLEEYGERSA